MPHWITTKAGNQIDLDWFDSNKSISDSIRDYYAVLSLKDTVDVSGETVHSINKAFNERYCNFKKRMCEVFFLPERQVVDGHYEYTYSYFICSRVNGKIKVYDAIDENEIERYTNKLDEKWG